MKGQINIVEMIFVLIILLVAFSVFFPRFFYESKWNDAYLLLTSRDLILTMDRIGKLYDFSFDTDSLKIFLNSTIPATETNIIAWSEAEGTIQNRVIVACDCTKSQIENMTSWFSGQKINNRTINVLFVQTNLSSIPEETDVLLIRNYKILDSYINNFQSYVAKGVGIVEMVDFPTKGDEVNNDRVQGQIFGLKWVNAEKGTPDYMVFARKPLNSSDIVYAPYKYFYHIPFPNGSSFEPVWNFSEFLSYILPEGQPQPGGWAWGTKGVTDIEPVDDNQQRILIKALKQQKEYPAVILNQTLIARTAWIADFNRNGTASDDQKTLLLSLLLWASKKTATAQVYLVKSGYSSSYINVKNTDMYEVYRFNLILAYPY